jgi:hypothetical protein
LLAKRVLRALKLTHRLNNKSARRTPCGQSLWIGERL